MRTSVTWTPWEIQFVREASNMGFIDRDIAKLLARTPLAVCFKRKSLGILKPAKQPKYEPPALEPQVLIADIQKAIAEEFDISLDEMLSDRRAREVARPRQVAMYLSRKLTRHSFPVIGRRFRRDHTTVMHAVSAITNLLLGDDELRKSVESVENRLQSTNFPTIHRPETCSSDGSESINCPMEQSKIMEAA